MLITVSPCLADEFIHSGERKSQKESMTIEDGRLTVEYYKVPLGEILDQLKNRNNIWFKGGESLLDENITVRFADFSLEDGIKRILGFINYALVYHSDGKLAGVMLFNKSDKQEKVITKAIPGLRGPSSSNVLQQRNKRDYSKETPPSYELPDERLVLQENIQEIQPVNESDIAPIVPVEAQTSIIPVTTTRGKAKGTLGVSLHMQNPLQGE
jgi:hypothetical protein